MSKLHHLIQDNRNSFDDKLNLIKFYTIILTVSWVLFYVILGVFKTQNLEGVMVNMPKKYIHPVGTKPDFKTTIDATRVDTIFEHSKIQLIVNKPLSSADLKKILYSLQESGVSVSDVNYLLNSRDSITNVNREFYFSKILNKPNFKNDSTYIISQRKSKKQSDFSKWGLIINYNRYISSFFIVLIYLKLAIPRSEEGSRRRYTTLWLFIIGIIILFEILFRYIHWNSFTLVGLFQVNLLFSMLSGSLSGICTFLLIGKLDSIYLKPFQNSILKWLAILLFYVNASIQPNLTNSLFFDYLICLDMFSKIIFLIFINLLFEGKENGLSGYINKMDGNNELNHTAHSNHKSEWKSFENMLTTYDSEIKLNERISKNRYT